jgi:hypothetical protein
VTLVTNTEEGETGLFLTAWTLLAIKEAALARKMIEPQVTRAMVGRISKSLGHRGRRKSWPRCVLL